MPSLINSKLTNTIKAEPPMSIAVPTGGPGDPCLYFVPTRSGPIPVYLCNPHPVAITDVKVTIGSPSEPELSPITTTMVGDGIVPPCHAILIDRYNPMWDGDALMFYGASYTDASGIQQSRKTIIDKGAGPENAWVTLT